MTAMSTMSAVGAMLSSPRLALVVMVLLAGVSAVGGSFHQAGVLRHAAYAALWGLLCLSIGVCTLRRWRWNVDALLCATTHVGLLALVAGFGWAAVLGEAGVVHFSLGTPISRLPVSQHQSYPLGFSIRLDGIEEEYDSVSRDILLLTLALDGRTREIPLAVGREIPVDGTSYRLHVLQTTERFSQEPSVPAEVRRDMALDDPALLLEIHAPGMPPDRRWLFANKPYVNVNRSTRPDAGVAFVRRPYVKQAIARFTLQEAEGAAKAVALAFNAPLQHAGYQFCLAGYDAQRRSWARVRVKKDPGAPALVGGMILTCLGVSYRLLLKPLNRHLRPLRSRA